MFYILKMMFLPTSLDEQDRQTEEGVDQDNLTRWLKNCLSGIMVLSQNRQVIKRAELTKLIYHGSRNQYFRITKLIMHKASHDLYKYMGMRLYDLGDSKGYILVNEHSELSQYRREHSQEQCNELAVIFLTLMEIFTSSDESSTEEQIREVLKHLDLEEDDLKKHFDFMLKKLYIVPVKEIIYQQDEKLYKWGPRAIAEVDPDRFMEAFLDLAEDGEAKDWPDQKRRIDLLKEIPNR